MSWNSWRRHSSSPAWTTATLFLSAFPPRHWCHFSAAIVLLVDRRSHTTAAQQDLHWLPVKYRIIFTIVSLMHHVLHRRYAMYLHFARPRRVQLLRHSAATSFYNQQSCCRSTNQDSVRTAGLRCLWSRHLEYSSPCAIRTIDSYHAFRRSL